MDTARRQERVRCKESNMEIYITICKTASQWEFAVWLRELKQGLCDNLEGWGGEGVGREVQEGGDMSVPILVDVWQKTTNFCKAIILQLKTKVAKKKVLTFIKIKKFCASKDYQERENTTTEWEKISAKHTLDKKPVSRTYKELLQLVNLKKFLKIQLKNRQAE